MHFVHSSEKDEIDKLIPYRWSLCKSYSLAFAIAAFPVLFLFDQAVEWDTSPILPGLLLIVITWVFSPFIAFEIMQRFNPKPELSELVMTRRIHICHTAIGVAFAWFLLWLAVGA